MTEQNIKNKISKLNEELIVAKKYCDDAHEKYFKKCDEVANKYRQLGLAVWETYYGYDGDYVVWENKDELLTTDEKNILKELKDTSDKSFSEYCNISRKISKLENKLNLIIDLKNGITPESRRIDILESEIKWLTEDMKELEDKINKKKEKIKELKIKHQEKLSKRA